MALSERQPAERGEAALGWAAVAASGSAVLAWAACCVLPMALAATGMGFGAMAWLASQRTWLTLVALAVLGAGGVLAWRRTRRCAVDADCRAPSRLSLGLLWAAGALVAVALVWQPILEPRLLGLLRSLRG